MLKAIGSASAAAAGVGSVSTNALAATESPFEPVDASNVQRYVKSVRGSDTVQTLSTRLERDWGGSLSFAEATVNRLKRRDRDHTLVTVPVVFSDDAAGEKSPTSDELKVSGDITAELSNGTVEGAYAVVSESLHSGLDRRTTTYEAADRDVSVSTDEVFDRRRNPVVVDEVNRSDVSADGAVCTFCDGLGNVICAVGCSVAYSLIAASLTISPPAGIAVGAAISSFCGIVTLLNESLTGTGCGVDWTTEQVCDRLYDC